MDDQQLKHQHQFNSDSNTANVHAYVQTDCKQEECNQPTDQSSSDNLDRYLENIFKTQCRFTIPVEEVNVIEKGTETLVSKVLDDYFKTQANVSLFNSSHEQYQLLKIGSYYEGTKNHFPDSFDYTVVLGNTDSKPDANAFPNKNLLKNVIDSEKEKYTVKMFVNTVYQEDCSSGCQERYTSRTHTPATLSIVDCSENGHVQILQVYYSNLPHCEHVINANVSFAFRAYNVERHLQCHQVTPKDFYKEIVKTGHVLYVSGSNEVEAEDDIFIIVVESEANFIRNVLSRNHIKVLRLLKYLINGNSFCVDQRRSSRKSIGLKITSRHIKNTVIHHHYSCLYSRGIGVCVFDILQVLTKLFTSEQFRDDKRAFVSQIYLVPGAEECSQVPGSGSCSDYSYIKRYGKAFKDFVKSLENLKTFDAKFETEACMIDPFYVSLINERRMIEKKKRRGMITSFRSRLSDTVIEHMSVIQEETNQDKN